MSAFQAEVYSEINVDGERLLMTIEAEQIVFGNRFEVNARWRFEPQHRQEVICAAFGFLRNYACLMKRSELGNGLRCYKKALRCRVANVETACWAYFDGLRPVPRAKRWAVVEWR